MIKFLFEIIYIILVVLANVLTFCGYTRLKEAQTNYKNIYEKYEKSTNSINQIYDENKVLLNDMGNDTKKASVARMEYGTTIRQNNHLYKPRVVTQAVRLKHNLTSSPS